MSVTNADRADWAETAIENFRQETCPGEDMETAARDLVTNILHYVRRECDVTDLEWWLKNRLNMHNTEVDEDEEG